MPSPYPALPLMLTLAVTGLSLPRGPLSSEYIPPALKTIVAPISVPNDNLLPNNQILRSKLTSFRTLRTIVTVNADDAEASRLTPRMQAYWVNTLTTR